MLLLILWPLAGVASGATTTPVFDERPYTVRLPSAYDRETPAPLLISLHGYGASGGLQERKFFHFRRPADARGWIYAYPNGQRDAAGQRYWNATAACCDFFFSQVDDVTYISGLIDEVSRQYNVDAERVFIVGHSNGGFMAHRLACELSDRVTAVVSIAGAEWLDASKCRPTSAVAVLEIHGDSDDAIAYDGGFISKPSPPYPLARYPPYPSAFRTVAHWARRNGCAAKASKRRERLNLDRTLAGDETKVRRFRSCARGGVQLWTIRGGAHIPFLTRSWAKPVFAFLAHAHP